MNVLFILSRDYGELFNAMYFSRNQPFHAALVMPEVLYRDNGTSLDVPCFEYRTVEDVISAYRAADADVVLLFSGYLMVINELMDESGLEEILSALERDHVPCATSDPTGGIIPAYGENTVEYKPGQRSLSKHLGWLARRFSRYPHLYTAPPLPESKNPVSFFNPAIAEAADGAAVPSKQAGWLFVLSAEDFAVQCDRKGRENFLREIAKRMKQTMDAERRPMLLAPQICLDAVAGVLGVAADTIGRPACDFHRYMDLLLDSEFVFSWNSFSASFVGRAFSRQPFFVFDRGHLADFLEPFFERAIGQFYSGAEPPMLAPDHPLIPEELELLAGRYVRQLDAALAHLSRSPTPVEALSLIRTLSQQAAPGR